jgi:hypothetical protein
MRVPIEFSGADAHGDQRSLCAAFAAERAVRVENFLDPATLACLREGALAGTVNMERSFIPLHKQGSTLSYEELLRRTPDLVAFYRDRRVQNWISALTSTRIYPTPLRDQSSLSLLCY